VFKDTANIALGVASGVGTYFATTSIRKLFSLSSAVISRSRLTQKLGKNDYIGIYGDIEECLGDFLENYRKLMREAPPRSSVGLLFSLSKDLLGAVRAILVGVFVRLFFHDNSVSK